jgi:hypothetical protein
VRFGAHSRVPARGQQPFNFPKSQEAHLKDITLLDLVARFIALKHVFQYSRFLLDLANFLRRLRSPVCLVPCIIASHDLHKLVSLLQVLWSTSTNQFL